MKKLFLIRHAKSDWDKEDLSDFDRPLNKRGMRDAPFIAGILKNRKIFPDLIYTSPAVRALTTAKIFADILDYPETKIVINENIYEAGIRDLENIVQNITDDYSSVFLFGHNMTITSYAQHIGNKIIGGMPTCSVAGIEFDFNSWKNVERGSGNTFLFEYPKKYSGKD